MMEVDSISSLTRPGEPVQESQRNLDDLDLDEILNRPRRRRGQFRRQKACLNKAPEFVKRLEAFEERKAESEVVFECQWQAFPRPNIKWYRDDEEIVDRDRFHQEEGDCGSTKLRIDNCRKEDEGTYKCKVENCEGVASTTGYLSVIGDNKDKKLSSQPRKNCQHAVSNPPRLIAITEQKSLELREEEEFNSMPPSPINDDIEHLIKEKIFHQKTSPPTTPDSDIPKKVVDIEEDGGDSGSDTSCDSQDFDRIPTYDPEEERETTPIRDAVDEGKPEGLFTEESGDHLESTGDGGCCHESQVFMLIKSDGRLEEVASIPPSPVNQPPSPTPSEGNHVQLSSKSGSTFVSSQTVLVAGHDACSSSKATPSVASPSKANVTTPSKATTSRQSKIDPQSGSTDSYDLSSINDDWNSDLCTLEFPWLLSLAFTSFGTFVASALELSPFWYVIALAVLSLLSFRFLVSTKQSQT